VNVTLFGYPKTGKTTLFNLLAGAHAAVSAYDDGKREPNVRAVPLPDPRLDRLAEAYPGKKKTAAALDLTDLAGISFGEVKTSLCLGHLRKADGLVHVARGFAGEDIPPSRGRIDPAADIRTMEEELVLADLVSSARLERLEKDLQEDEGPRGEKAGPAPGLRPALRIRPGLEPPDGARRGKAHPQLRFLTLKPLLASSTSTRRT
jgi:ribosome-binding ATPase YchF (GTP1/OBG family)